MIKATATSSDGKHTVSFDATSWFSNATDGEIKDLHEDWEDAVDVALWVDTPELRALFEYCEYAEIEFGVVVSASDAMDWLLDNNPTLARLLS